VDHKRKKNAVARFRELNFPGLMNLSLLKLGKQKLSSKLLYDGTAQQQLLLFKSIKHKP